MISWNVLQNSQGELQLLEDTLPVPEGWTVVAVTVNPEYLEYMSSVQGEP